MKFFYAFSLSLYIIHAPCFAGKAGPYENEQDSISLPRTPSPTHDLRLHPAKGFTVWKKEFVRTCRHPYFGGKVFVFTYTDTYEVTCAHPAWNPDLLTVAFRLEQHNISITGSLKERTVRASYCPKGQDTSFSIEGVSEQFSLFLKLDPEVVIQQPVICGNLLTSILSNAKTEGMIKVWTELKKVTHQGNDFLAGVGFSEECRFINFKNGGQTSQYSLDLSDFDDDFHPNPDVRVQWEDQQFSSSYPLFENRFAFFMRNENGEIQGASFGKIYLEKSIPFCEIEALWVAPSFRGHHFGATLLEIAENYARQVGAHFIQLGTSDYQAPWLYSKKGYTCFRTLENVTLLPDGAYSNSYGFRKRL